MLTRTLPPTDQIKAQLTVYKQIASDFRAIRLAHIRTYIFPVLIVLPLFASLYWLVVVAIPTLVFFFIGEGWSYITLYPTIKMGQKGFDAVKKHGAFETVNLYHQVKHTNKELDESIGKLFPLETLLDELKKEFDAKAKHGEKLTLQEASEILKLRISSTKKMMQEANLQSNKPF